MKTQLDAIAEKFSVYKGDRSKVRYPKALWEEVYSLSSTFSEKEIARAIRVNPHYLARKLRSFAQKTISAHKFNFAEVEVETPLCSEKYQLDFTASNGSSMRLHFSGNNQQVENLVKSLAGIR